MPYKNNARRRVPRQSVPEFVADYRRLRSVSALSARWGVSYQTARMTLKEHGVDTPRQDLWADVPLGSLPDRVLAEQIGSTKSAVWEARTRKKIPSYRERTGKSTPRGPMPQTAAQMAAHRGLWKIDEASAQLMILDYERLKNVRLVAEKWGLGKMTTWRTLKRYGVDMSRKGRCVEGG